MLVKKIKTVVAQFESSKLHLGALLLMTLASLPYPLGMTFPTPRCIFTPFQASFLSQVPYY